jgi:hypothetical protein
MKQFGFGGTDLVRCLQKFAAVHSSFHNHLNQERHVYSRLNLKLNRAAVLSDKMSLSRAGGTVRLNSVEASRVYL